MLNKHTVLFDSILKVFLHQLVHLDILPNVTPRHLRAYPVANIHLDVFKAKLSHLCDIGILEYPIFVVVGKYNVVLLY